MRKVFLLITIIIAGLTIFFLFQYKSNSSLISTPMPHKNLLIREPAVAGQFYPADKNELSTMLDNFLAAATTTPAISQPRILIVPHAGYVFSGATAAHA